MRMSVGLSIAALLALPTLALAQAPLPFDGTYRLVSSAKVTQTYTAKGGQTGPCPDRAAGPLTVQGGRAQYTSETGRALSGTVGPQGQLNMQAIEPGSSRVVELDVTGTIDARGTARGRQRGFGCSYDFVWQR